MWVLWNDNFDFPEEEGNVNFFDEVSAALATLVTFFVLWAGISWKSDALTNSLPVFWPTIGAVVAIVLGSLSGVYVGTIALHAAYNREYNQASYWNPTGMKWRLHFADEYGGIMYHLVRVFETLMTVTYMFMAIGLAATPYYLALELQTYLNENASTAEAVQAQGFNLLVNGLIILLGSWAAAYTLTNDTDDILGFYDRIMQDIFETDEDTRDDISNGDLIYDLIMHVIKSFAVVLLGLVEAMMAWAYVYYQFVPYGSE